MSKKKSYTKPTTSKAYALQLTKEELESLISLLEHDDLILDDLVQPHQVTRLRALHAKLQDAREASAKRIQSMRTVASLLRDDEELAQKMANAGAEPNTVSQFLETAADVEAAMEC